jgi:hypothetical protein
MVAASAHDPKRIFRLRTVVESRRGLRQRRDEQEYVRSLAVLGAAMRPVRDNEQATLSRYSPWKADLPPIS